MENFIAPRNPDIEKKFPEDRIPRMPQELPLLDDIERGDLELGEIQIEGIEAQEGKSDISEVKCVNERYEGKTHPETGVPFERKTIEHDGVVYEGVFPEFQSTCDATIPEDKYDAPDREHIKICNEQLKDAVENDPEIKAKFSDEQLEQIANGDTPDGFTWHHSEEPGKMQLVDTDTHRSTGHIGGRVIWGGGREARA